MTTKKKIMKPEVMKPRSAFTVRLDETRTIQMLALTKKKGVSQNGIVNIAISEMHEKEFPAIPRKQ